MKLSEAKEIATRFIERYSHLCERVEIAGSIRREKPEVKDIEIVAIPAYGTDLFGNVDKSYNPLLAQLVEDGHQFNRGDKKANGIAAQIVLTEGINLDLFCATRENWGWIFVIRTGSAEFSHALMSENIRKGYTLNKGIPHKILGCDADGKAEHESTSDLTFPEEVDVFRFLDLECIPPSQRIDKSSIRRLAGASV